MASWPRDNQQPIDGEDAAQRGERLAAHRARLVGDGGDGGPEISDADIDQVANALPQLIAMQHGCLPEECDVVNDMLVRDWRAVARDLLAVWRWRLLPFQPAAPPEQFSTWYQSLTPDGRVWCQSSNPDEVRDSLDMPEAHGGTLQRLRKFTVWTSWEPWDGTTLPVKDTDGRG